MARLFGAILFLILASMVLMLTSEHLPLHYLAGAAILVPLIGIVAAVSVFAPQRRRRR